MIGPVHAGDGSRRTPLRLKVLQVVPRPQVETAFLRDPSVRFDTGEHHYPATGDLELKDRSQFLTFFGHELRQVSRPERLRGYHVPQAHSRQRAAPCRPHAFGGAIGTAHGRAYGSPDQVHPAEELDALFSKFVFFGVHHGAEATAVVHEADDGNVAWIRNLAVEQRAHDPAFYLFA